MAIQKTKTLPNGAVGNYWRITSITLDRQTYTAIATIALFKDAATSMSGAPPLGAYKTFRFTWSLSDIAGAANIIAYVYTKIMAAANVMHSYDIAGNAITPAPADSDIFDGTLV